MLGELDYMEERGRGFDAYYLQCCVEHGLPLLSLDGRMCDVARRLAVRVME
jgi:predicted nucleic acid-binding protein